MTAQQDPETPTFVGSSVRRVEDPRLLCGLGSYVDDLAPDGCLHLSFVRSQWPHAALHEVDVTPALELPGIVAAWAGRDLVDAITSRPGIGPPGLSVPMVEAICTDRVRFSGDVVAVVVATSRAQAEDGAEAVIIDAEPMEPVVLLDDALDPEIPPIFADIESNVVYNETFIHGDPMLYFPRGAKVVRRSIRQSRQANMPMEGRAVLAQFSDGHLSIDTSFQNPFALRAGLAERLGLSEDAITVRTGDIGGSFGQKAYPMREDSLVAHAAIVLGRPVKWTEDRVENLLAAGHARDESLHVAAAVEDDGRILAVQVAMSVDQGAYPLGTLPSSIIPTLVRVLFPGPYSIDHLRFDARVYATNKASYVAYRGPWEAETFARERLLDAIAHDLGLDPVAVRRRNLIPSSDYPREMVTGPTQEGIAIHKTLDRALDMIDYDATIERAAALRAAGTRRGVGFAVVLEPAPGPQNYAVALGASGSPRDAQSAWARIDADGRAVVHTSQVPHGQSHHTTLAQLAADQLGVDVNDVVVVSGNTDDTPFNLVGTGGSRAATLASGAVLGATRDLAGRILDRAAAMLEAAPSDLELHAGTVRVKGTPTRLVTFESVVATGDPLDVEFFYQIPPGGWTQATHACEVEVDEDTGEVHLLRYVVAEDCGRLINPAVVDGQICGGVVQGVAGVLHERFAYSEDGQPLTTTLMDYTLPLATDMCRIEISHLELPTHGPDEFRGVGEGGAIGAPAALVSAIENALSASDVQIGEQYLPPWRLRELLGHERPW